MELDDEPVEEPVEAEVEEPVEVDEPEADDDSNVEVNIQNYFPESVLTAGKVAEVLVSVKVIFIYIYILHGSLTAVIDFGGRN